MSDFSHTPQEALTPHFLTTWTRYSAQWNVWSIVSGYGAATATWGTANQARYVPMYVPWPYRVRRVFWVNGSTASGNMDFGIYNEDGVRLYSTGSTAQSGASAPQFVTPSTPFILSPGRYIFAQNCSGTTNAMWGNVSVTAEQLQWCGIFQQAVGATALPATATFAASTVAGIGMCGVTWTTTGF